MDMDKARVLKIVMARLDRAIFLPDVVRYYASSCLPDLMSPGLTSFLSCDQKRVDGPIKSGHDDRGTSLLLVQEAVFAVVVEQGVVFHDAGALRLAQHDHMVACRKGLGDAEFGAGQRILDQRHFQ